MTFPVGNYSHEPTVTRGILVVPIARYTDPKQIDFFRASINQAYGTNCNVRFDPDDPSGTTIRWFHDYYLRLGEFLYDNYLTATEEQIRTYFAPLERWPEDLSPPFDPLPGEDPPPGETPETPEETDPTEGA